jgi:predicted RNA-binding Zn-ribbon protein involved in translation (DUF1610 family)
VWQFDDKKYTKDVLVPAVKAFTADGRHPDVFERYHLPLDVSAASDIETALQQVKAYWNKLQLTNARFKPLLDVLLNAHEGVAAELRDPGLRVAQRAVAQQVRAEREQKLFEQLDRSIGLVAAKGHVTKEDVAGLIARHTRDGLSEAQIRARIKVEERQSEPVVQAAGDGLPSGVSEKIRNNLGVLGKPDLYAFLGTRPDASASELQSAYQDRLAFWRKRPPEHDKSAADELLGIVRTHLLGGDLSRYEATRVADLVAVLREDVRLAGAKGFVEEAERAQLLFLAKELGLSDEQADRYVVALAHELGVTLQGGGAAAEPTVRCGGCQRVLPRAEAGKNCPSCGAELWVACPKCGARALASDRACGACGFVLAQYPAFQLQLARARAALQAGDVTAALDAARAAEQLWGRTGEVAVILARVEDQVRDRDALRSRVDVAVSERRFFEAARVLAPLRGSAPQHRFRDGLTTEDLGRRVDAAIARAEAAAARARQLERAGDTEGAWAAYHDALAAASDLPPARDGLLRCPPAPPGNVRARTDGDHVLVRWEPGPSAGVTGYVIVRRERRAPLSPGDGQRVASGAATSCVDAGAPAGVPLGYAVFAERDGAFSAPAAAAAMTFTPEVSGLRLRVSDGHIVGEWQPPPGRARIRVFRREGGDPAGPGDGLEITPQGAHGFADRDVQNGRTYHYRVCVEYEEAGPAGRALTRGVCARATPERPPRALESIELEYTEAGVRVRWQPPDYGEVVIRRGAAAPAQRPGDVLTAAQVAAAGTPLVVERPGAAVDTALPQGISWYTALTRAGDVTVLGASRRFLVLPEVDRTEVEDRLHYLLVRWQWPPAARLALVAWRHDRWPEGPDDPLAQKASTSLAEYERQDGFRIAHPAAQPHYVMVFAASRVDGANVFSVGLGPGTRAEARTRPPVRIAYSVKRGLFKRRRVAVTLVAREEVAALPELVLAARRGDVEPLSLEGCRVLATKAGLRLAPSHALTFEVDLDGLDGPHRLRLFFRESAAYQAFRLEDPAPAQLCLG